MRNILFVLLSIQFIAGQGVYKKNFLLNENSGAHYDGYLYGNGIVDLLVKDSLVWAATGYGLNKTIDAGESWTSYRSVHYKGKGGVAAMAYMDDSTLWISTAFDTVAQDEEMAAGGGLSYTRDGGQTWKHISQPIDDRNETEYSPTTTNISNITYDIAALDSVVWITSWAGGLRKTSDMGKTWQVVTIDGKPFRAANDNLIHLAFSVIEENGNLWVGTAGGIGKSSDGGENWQIYNHQKNGISGNFVVALGYQEFNQTLWVASIAANDTSEYRAVSKSSNGGVTWDVVLPGIFPHNFSFDGPRAYVAADEGLFVSDDDGDNWYKIPEVKDYSNGEEILAESYYSSAVQPLQPNNRLWIGSSDGLAWSVNNGNDWHVIRSYVRIKERPEPAAYAYPSPFSPSRDGFIRFECGAAQGDQVDIKIYDFAMDHVRTVPDNSFKPKWDGQNENGDQVASGVFYFRAEVNGNVTWGKLVVIN